MLLSLAQKRVQDRGREGILMHINCMFYVLMNQKEMLISADVSLREMFGLLWCIIFSDHSEPSCYDYLRTEFSHRSDCGFYFG